MKRLKFLSCLLLLLVLLGIPALAETPVSTGVQTGDREKDSTVEKIITRTRGYYKAGKFEEALKILDTALKKFPQKKHREKLQIERANVHVWRAVSLKKKYDYANAIKHLEMAYTIDKNHRPKGAAMELNTIGFLYDALGQKHKALEYYEKALPIIQALEDRAEEAWTLNNIGKVYYDLSQKKKALEYYEKVLPIYQEMGGGVREAITFNNIGKVYYDLGQKQKALEYFEKALPISQAVGDRVVEATSLDNIGTVYYFLGQKQKTLEYFKKSLLIYQKIGDRVGEVNALKNIGGIYFTLGQTQKALEYLEKAKNR